MFKDTLQVMINAEFGTSKSYSKYDKKQEKTNYRNGTTKKNLKSEFGDFEPKNVRDVSGIEDKIISLYARKLTTREVNEQIQNLYGIEVSATMISISTFCIILILTLTFILE